MATRVKGKDGDPVRRELTALKRRVSWLEAALQPEMKTADRSAAAARRDSAASDERHQAIMAYHRQQQEELLRRSPFALKALVKIEHQLNEYLQSRGFPPEPSSVPESLQQEAEELKKWL